MDFSTISSVNSYVKSLELKQKWQKKKNEGALTPQSQIDAWIKEQKKNAQGIPGTPHRNKNLSMDLIYTKISSGKKLTYEEESYLRETSPATYQHVKSFEQKQASYERDLKRCKTKDEVERLKMSHVMSSMASISSISNSSEIPKECKYQLIMAENSHLNAVERITAKFVQSGAYADLPTDEEKREAEKALQEAQSNLPESEDVSEKTQPAENSENPFIEVTYTETSKKSADTEGIEHMTVTEAYNTPEMQKLRRARARASYANTKNQAEEYAAGANGTQINMKI